MSLWAWLGIREPAQFPPPIARSEPPGVMEDGHSAQRLLENELLRRTFEEMKRDAYESWLSLAPADEGGLTRLKLHCEAIKQFELTLGAKVAAMDKQLHEEKLQQEQRKWR